MAAPAVQPLRPKAARAGARHRVGERTGGAGPEAQPLVYIQLLVVQEGSKGWRGLQGVLGSGKPTGGKGVGAVVEHALGEMGGLSVSLDAEVAEHGVTFPAAQETDGVRVNLGTEEGGGSTRAQGAGREEEGINARGGGEGSGTVAKGIGDMAGLDRVPLAALSVVVAEERSISRRVGELEAAGDATEGFDGTEEGVGVGAMTHLFTTDSILLVREGQEGQGDGLDGLIVMQRHCRRRMLAPVDGEGDILEEEGLGPGVWIGGLQVLGRTEEPVEGNDDEIDGVAVEETKGRVVEVEDMD